MRQKTSTKLCTVKQPSDLGYIASLRRSPPLLELEEQTSKNVKEEHHQLPSPSRSNSPKQFSERKRKRSVSPKPPSDETDNSLSKRRKTSWQTPVQSQETSFEANCSVLERPEGAPEAIENKEEDTEDPISHWAANHTWPANFADRRAMSSSIAKRQRTSDRSPSAEEGKSRSYSQSRKDGDAPVQYTKAFEKRIFEQNLDMDDSKGAKLISLESKQFCNTLRNVKSVVISPTVYTMSEVLEVVRLCRNRNEAMVQRDVTPLIVPPLKSLYLKDGGITKDGGNNKNGVNAFEHLADEVNTQWHKSWDLTGPRPKPDLAIGFLSSAFSIAETRKLTNYTSFDNLTRPTEDMCFPFLMCEVKCGNEALDYADRQNMHSCSVAVKALLKIEQKADQYREDKQFEKLLGKILVYSISHDHTDARLYGHYALVEGEKWTYYRHYVRHFDIGHEEKDLLALHNFARNVMTTYAPELLNRLHRAIAVLPTSSTLSFSADTMSLEDFSQQGSQQPSQGRDAEGFVTPGLPASVQRMLDAQKEQLDRILSQTEQQKEQQKEQMERQLQIQKEQMERQLQIQKEQMERQMERQMKQMEQMERQIEEERSEKRELMNLLKQRLQ